MSTGGRKDAKYIAEMMEGIIQPYDPDRTRSTLFCFDGASNVQKAGKVLEASSLGLTLCMAESMW
jgi:hypothetical protein